MAVAVGILNPIVLAYILVVTVVTYATAGYDPEELPGDLQHDLRLGTVLFIVLLAGRRHHAEVAHRGRQVHPRAAGRQDAPRR